MNRQVCRAQEKIYVPSESQSSTVRHSGVREVLQLVLVLSHAVLLIDRSAEALRVARNADAVEGGGRACQ